MAKPKIFIADSHEVVRLGISFIIQCSHEFEVVGQTGSCHEVLRKAEELQPDVIIMEARMTDGNSIECCRKIKESVPKIKVIMLVTGNDDEAIFSCISAGVDGLLLKQFNSEELIRSIHMVLEGKALLDPSITNKVLDRVKNGQPKPQPKDVALLNPQERRILSLIAEGKTNKEIAQILTLSNNTIKNYVSGILSKLNFSNRAEAAAYAVRNNLMAYSKAVNDRRGN